MKSEGRAGRLDFVGAASFEQKQTLYVYAYIYIYIYIYTHIISCITIVCCNTLCYRILAYAI